jgi:hypothetical protein
MYLFYVTNVQLNIILHTTVFISQHSTYVYLTSMICRSVSHNTLICVYVYVCVHYHNTEIWLNIPQHTNVWRVYRVSQEECARLREGVLYVKVYRYNPKQLYPKLNGYGGNGQRKVWSSCCIVPVKLTRFPYTAYVLESGMQSTLSLHYERLVVCAM